jgi:hypothetical protein
VCHGELARRVSSPGPPGEVSPQATEGLLRLHLLPASSRSTRADHNAPPSRSRERSIPLSVHRAMSVEVEGGKEAPSVRCADTSPAARGRKQVAAANAVFPPPVLRGRCRRRRRRGLPPLRLLPASSRSTRADHNASPSRSRERSGPFGVRCAMSIGEEGEGEAPSVRCADTSPAARRRKQVAAANTVSPPPVLRGRCRRRRRRGLLRLHLLPASSRSTRADHNASPSRSRERSIPCRARCAMSIGEVGGREAPSVRSRGHLPRCAGEGAGVARCAAPHCCAAQSGGEQWHTESGSASVAQ